MAIHDSFYTNQFLDVAEFHGNSAADHVTAIEGFASLHPGHRILDLACGFGRHSLLLAQKGYNVLGFDQSGDYITIANSEAERLNLTVRFQKGDMRQLDMSEEFDAVLSLQSSLAFYDDESNTDILRRINRALKKGGSFVLDQANVFWFASLASRWEPTVQELADGRIHRYTLSFNANTCIGSGRSVLESEGQSVEGGWDLRFYTLPELRSLSQEIGFAVAHCYGNWDGSQYGTGSPRLITVMVRQ